MKLGEAVKTAEFWFTVFCVGACALILFGIKVNVVLGSYASASTVAHLSTDVDALKIHRDDDQLKLDETNKKIDYILRRVDGLGDQVNHWAISGHLVYVPPPPKSLLLSHGK